ncbi:MAG: prephenate dehydratase [Ignavibacteria bacterium]|nr:prephenate dehydratase [Ignavibacteria bacterium]MBI3765450.1 prephenate dehydratase [Ignavibacteriales bacterium]
MNRTSKAVNRLRVAFQGERGAFSEQAALAYFRGMIDTIPVKTFMNVFRAVHRGTVRCGIVPIENSLYGSIHQNYDLLQAFNLKIVGELKLRVVHALLVNPGVMLRKIKYIYSHPQALGQCETFLDSLRGVEVVAFYDTAGAAKFIRESGRTDAAAIASLEAAKVYRLKVLRSGIESDHQNFTRFLVLSKQEVVPKVRAKTSIIFSIKDMPGGLFKALSVFALRDINLYKIESRPLIGRPWEYLFYLDFQGSIRDEASRNAIDHLKEISTYMKILGSYSEGKTVGQRRR